MKILHVIYSLSFGGAERFAVDLCNSLSDNEGDVVCLLTICDIRLPGCSDLIIELNNKVIVRNLYCSSGLSLKSLLAVFRFIVNEKPDVVHCHSNLLLLYLPMLLYPCRYFHTLHSTASHCLRFKLLKRFSRYFYNNRIQPITVSLEGSNSYGELYGLRNDILIINGRLPLTRSIVLPHELTNGTAGYTFIHVANCTTPKNNDRLFRVFERLQKEEVSFTLYCIGKGYEVYQKRYDNNTQIHILGVKSNVSEYLSFSDFFVLSSDYEGMPISLLEAMSLGVVPISTPAGGVKDVIRDGENGYMSEGFGDEQLYEKIKQAIAEYGRISKNALVKEFEENYSIGICAERYYKLYNKLN